MLVPLQMLLLVLCCFPLLLSLGIVVAAEVLPEGGVVGEVQLIALCCLTAWRVPRCCRSCVVLMDCCSAASLRRCWRLLLWCCRRVRQLLQVMERTQAVHAVTLLCTISYSQSTWDLATGHCRTLEYLCTKPPVHSRNSLWMVNMLETVC